MDAEQACQSYLRDLIYTLRERGGEATRKRLASSSEFEEGREVAYREILDHMRSQAEIFGLEMEALGLTGFEPLTGPLDPSPLKPTGE
jgi:hypothetical protein